MHDPILFSVPESEQKFQEIVREALKSYREGHVLALSMSQLAQSPLINACILTDEPVSPDVRGRAMRLVLRWAVDKLQPSGTHSWLAFNWRLYNVLHAFYIQRKRIWEIAEHMGIANQTIFQIRPKAIEQVSSILYEELTHPKFETERRLYAMSDRYARFTSDEQKILRLLTIFSGSIPLDLLHKLAEQIDIVDIHASLNNLVMSHLVMIDNGGREVLIHPEVRSYVFTALSPTERRTWYTLSAQHYQSHHAYLTAACHLREAGNHQASANMLIRHYQDIMDTLGIEELREILTTFHPSEVSPSAWVRLKIIAGQAAEFMADFESALQEYGHALRANDIQTKAEAYYRRAKVFEHRNIDEALAHYMFGINLLEQTNKPQPLLPKIYIHQAWIFIQERQDFERAEASLNQAESLIESTNRVDWADLQNAWGGLFYRQGIYQEAVEHRFQGWIAANELGDVARKIKLAHNLGWDYVNLKQYENALHYLKISRDLAREAANPNMEGASNKGIGGCYFWLDDYKKAIDYYEKAYNLFIEVDNRNWQAHVCYDLAEAHAKLENITQMRHYFQEGMSIAQDLDDQSLLHEFEALASLYTQIIPSDIKLNKQQKLAWEYVKQYKRVTNREYRKLTGTAKKTASRHLKDMCDKGVLVKKGSTRDAYYVLV